MSKVKALYHIVFCTKSRKMTIPLAYKEDLYRFIWRKLNDNRCKLLRIGGIQNHIHMLIDLHPTVALSSLLQVIKGSSSIWMKSDPRFAHYEGWAGDYFACTLSPDARSPLIEYIKNQEQHHLGQPIENEISTMYKCADLLYDERDLQ